MSTGNQVTAEGLARLKAELENLKGPERLRIAETIRDAKSHGDLRENAAYHEAKLNQTRLEKRIADLEQAIQRARVVEQVEGVGIGLGRRVTLYDVEFEEEIEVVLAGDFEADPAKGELSVSSPLGRALAEQEEGAEFTVKTPDGDQVYRVVRVHA